MSTLTDKEVLTIAHLARLAIRPEDITGYQQNLSNILDFVSQLNKVDTTGIEPMPHPLALAQRLREDKVTEQNQRDTFQKLTPHTEAGLYLVPQVIE